MALSRHQLNPQVGALIQKEIPSPVFGGDLLVREMTRRTYREIVTAAATDVDRWNAGLFAAMVIDPATDKPMFSADEVLGLANRNELWVEILRIAQIGLDLSEVGKESLKSENTSTHD